MDSTAKDIALAGEVDAGRLTREEMVAFIIEDEQDRVCPVDPDDLARRILFALDY